MARQARLAFAKRKSFLERELLIIPPWAGIVSDSSPELPCIKMNAVNSSHFG
jgi:hypothetical protein